MASTALGVAMVRAVESERADRLFLDPLARVFANFGGAPAPDIDSLDESARAAVLGMYGWITARTRFLDDVCATAIADGVQQAVILGAGLDARGYRLGWPTSATLFEIDRADIFAFKESALASGDYRPACRLTRVTADLQDEWWKPLQDAGFDAGQPTVWLAEGLLVYLPAEVVRRLLEMVTELSAPGSRFGMTLRRIGASGPARTDSDPFAAVKAMWHSSGGLDPAEWLAENGWDTRITHPRTILAAAGRATENGGSDREPPRLVEAVRA